MESTILSLLQRLESLEDQISLNGEESLNSNSNEIQEIKTQFNQLKQQYPDIFQASNSRYHPKTFSNLETISFEDQISTLFANETRLEGYLQDFHYLQETEHCMSSRPIQEVLGNGLRIEESRKQAIQTLRETEEVEREALETILHKKLGNDS